MKNIRIVFAETRELREHSYPIALAGVLAIGWGMTQLPEHQLTATLGVALVFFAFIFDVALLLAAWVRLPTWERYRDRMAFESWKADGPKRVADGIAAYQADRCRSGREFDLGYAEGYEHGQRDGKGAS